MDYETAREFLRYEPETGNIYWRKRTSPKAAKGDVAGCTASRYRLICFRGRNYKAARVAWLLMNGSWPDGQIDHINCDRYDDRWENLRLADRFQNNWNKGKNRTNTSGYKGVTWDKQARKWRAAIKHNHKCKFLGLFDDPEVAYTKYCETAIRLRGEFAHV